MKNTKFLYLISFFNLALLITMLTGFNNTGDKSISIGYNAKIVERDSNLVIMYGDDTPRVIIIRSSNDMIIGTSSVNPKGSITAEYINGTNGISNFDKLSVNATEGSLVDLYVDGTSQMTGYLKVDSVQSRTLYLTSTNTSLKADGRITARSVNTDSLTTGVADNLPPLGLKSVSGITLGSDNVKIYRRDNYFIIAYGDGGDASHYFYFDMNATASITELIYSPTEP